MKLIEHTTVFWHVELRIAAGSGGLVAKKQANFTHEEDAREWCDSHMSDALGLGISRELIRVEKARDSIKIWKRSDNEVEGE